MGPDPGFGPDPHRNEVDEESSQITVRWISDVSPAESPSRARAALVTGGAGFIGSELTTQLVAGGWRVTVLDDLTTGAAANLEHVAEDRLTLVVGDIRDGPLAAALMREVSTVFHLACVDLRRSLAAPREAHDVNATATLELLMIARAAGVDRFVYTSSSEVYGTALAPHIAEDHPTTPTTAYGASKLAGEAYARAFTHTWRLPTVVVRPFNSFGPRCHHEGSSGEVIPRFLLRAMAGLPLVIFGDGSQSRDFTFVSDTARGILLCGTLDAAVGQTINIGSGREITVGVLARMVAAASGREPVIEHSAARPGDVGRQCADGSRARRLLGFTPRVSVERGLRRLRAWYDARGIDPRQLLEREVLRNWEPAALAAGELPA